MAARSVHTVDSFLPVMAEDARTRIQDLEADIREGEAASAERDRQDQEYLREREAHTRHARLLPSADALDRVVRYEAHLNRQLASALQQLRTWRSGRSQSLVPADGGRNPPPPAAQT